MEVIHGSRLSIEIEYNSIVNGARARFDYYFIRKWNLKIHDNHEKRPSVPLLMVAACECVTIKLKKR